MRVAGRGSRTLGKKLHLTELLGDLMKKLQEKFKPKKLTFWAPLALAASCPFLLILAHIRAKNIFIEATRMAPCKGFFSTQILTWKKKKEHSFYVGVSVCCSDFMWLPVSRSATWVANQRMSACLTSIHEDCCQSSLFHGRMQGYLSNGSHWERGVHWWNVIICETFLKP